MANKIKKKRPRTKYTRLDTLTLEGAIQVIREIVTAKPDFYESLDDLAQSVFNQIDREEEEAEAFIRKNREALKKSAIDKLTPDEMKALGI